MKILKSPVPAKIAPLSLRETQVLQLIAVGHSSREIARELTETTTKIDTRTVETHRVHIMEKLGLHTVAELTCWSVLNELIIIEGYAAVTAD